MTPQEFAAELLAAEDDARLDLLASAEIQDPAFADAVMQHIAKSAAAALAASIDKAEQTAELMAQLAAQVPTPNLQAEYAMTIGNIDFIGRGSYVKAIAAYDRAADLFASNGSGRADRQASALIGKVGALTQLGRYDEAIELDQQISTTFRESGDFERLAATRANIAFGVHLRRGDDQTALALFDEADTLLAERVDSEHPYRGLIAQNRAIPLRHLGRFADAIASSDNAFALLTARGADAEAMRARQNKAMTYFVVGRFDEALQLFDEVRDFWQREGRSRDAVAVELFACQGLLSLHRYEAVAEKCAQIAVQFAELGASAEMANALLLHARANIGLNKLDIADSQLTQAAERFQTEGNQFAALLVRLEQAAIALQQERYAMAFTIATELAEAFRQRNALTPLLRAELIAGAAQVAMGGEGAEETLINTIATAEFHQLSDVLYRAYELLGDWHMQQAAPIDALAAYETAITHVERLRGRMMVEFRVLFADQTFAVYEKATAVCIQLGELAQALGFAERAKSRILLDMISHQIDLSLQARDPNDDALIAELLQLRDERDRLYRQLESREDLRLSATVVASDANLQLRQQIARYEQSITELWHQLLIRNAAYEQDAALWQVQVRPVQSLLAADTLLIEFFVVNGRYLAFCVTSSGIEVVWISAEIHTIEQWLRFFYMNCERVVPNVDDPEFVATLNTQATKILQQLYTVLLAPLQDHLVQYKQLIIVPHQSLHYLPFHALHDGEQFLVDRCAISYLPSASLLAHNQAVPTANQASFVAFGYSNENQLAYTVEEAQTAATIMDGVAYLEEAATVGALHQAFGHADVLHVATHGQFNAQNALFSSLTLADGHLITLDLFNTKIHASLVTLSACRTGENTVSQGEELIGLMRGFLAAGASSLLLTHWSVEDQSASLLMERFYQGLQVGLPKAEALRLAQCQFKREESTRFAHPYFWAAYYLVGDAGVL